MKPFLCVDFGAGTLKLAEFDSAKPGVLRLLKYGTRPLGAAGSKEAERGPLVEQALKELMAELGIAGRGQDVHLCVPGYQVFSKFITFPPTDDVKLRQIIGYEAQQNVPFPLDEVTWDYADLGSKETGEREVLIAAVKTEAIEAYYRAVQGAKLNLQVVDASAAALDNAFRYNYGELEGCTMLLDIGAKTSNAMFMEKGRFFARGVNIGANAITQEFSNEAQLPFEEAEEYKKTYGYVHLGGAYEESEDWHQATISKIARQVFTRLHIQINQTIQFYRGQGGSAPERLYLAGGASLLGYTADFFSEKIGVQVEYFNPFRNVEMGPAVDSEKFSLVASTLGEVAGLGLRKVVDCPAELNLIPRSEKINKVIDKKKPYVVAAVYAVAAIFWIIGWFNGLIVTARLEKHQKIQAQIQPMVQNQKVIAAKNAEMTLMLEQSKAYEDLLHERFQWVQMLDAVQGALADLEKVPFKSTNAPPGAVDAEPIEVAVWISSLKLSSDAANPANPVAAMALPVPPTQRGKAVAAPTNQADKLWVKFRARNLLSSAATGNEEFAQLVAKMIQTNAACTNFFEPKESTLTNKLDQVGVDAVDYGFEMLLKLKRPIPLDSKRPAGAFAGGLPGQ
jgi:type IV pilus assembly protein PilM